MSRIKTVRTITHNQSKNPFKKDEIQFFHADDVNALVRELRTEKRKFMKFIEKIASGDYSHEQLRVKATVFLLKSKLRKSIENVQ